MFLNGDETKVVPEFNSTPLRLAAPAERRVFDQDFPMGLNEFGHRMSRDHAERCHGDDRGHGQAGEPSEGGLIPKDGPSMNVDSRSVPDLMADRCHGGARTNLGCGCRGYEASETLETDAKASPTLSSSYIVSTMADAKEFCEANGIIPYLKAEVCSSI